MSDKFTITLDIDKATAKQILSAESVCRGEGQAGYPNEILEAIVDYFPDEAVQFDFLFKT